MDVFDLKLLDILQENNQLTSEQLADKVGISSSTVQRRTKALRASGVIAADISIVSPQMLERRLMTVTSLILDREDSTSLMEFRRKMTNCDEVMQFYYVTGQADFVAIMTFTDMNDYHEFVEENFNQNPLIKKFSTNVVVNSVKVGLKIPVPKEQS